MEIESLYSPNGIHSHIPYEEPVGYGEAIPEPTCPAFSVAGVGQVGYIYDQPLPGLLLRNLD